MNKIRKAIVALIAAIMMLGMASVSHADSDIIDQWQPSVPGSAKVYGAGTCHYGFTTSRYLPKPSNGFGSLIYVSTEYVIWDGQEDGDMFEYVKPKDQNGNYLKNNWGLIYTGSGADNMCYSILTMTPLPTSTRIYLRVENPGYTNGTINFRTGRVIQNMEVRGYFWL